MQHFGPFRFDPDTGYLRRGTADVPLPPRAQALLAFFLEHPGRVLSKDEILDAVWGDVHVTDTSLKEAIHVLRLALGDTPQAPDYVETVPRRGYRFVHPVRRQQATSTIDRSTRPSFRRPAGGAAARASAPLPSRGWRLGWWLGGLSIALVLAMLGVAQLRRPPAPAPAPASRFEIRLPPGHRVTPGPPNLALSPDGRHLVYVAKSRGQRQLFLRPVARLESLAIAGTEDASAPFFSPDGRWIGFMTAAGLHRVAVDGGEVETLCEIRSASAASWGVDGIVMSLLDPRDNAGLWSVPAAGGRPRVLTTRQPGETAHRWPEVLPDGGAALFTVWRSGFEDAEIVLLDLGSGERSVLFAGSQARYAASGHLLFLCHQQLWAVAFDARRRKVAGDPAPVLSGVATTPVFGTAHFAVASTGSLVFMPRIESPPPVLRRIGGGAEAARIEIDLSGTVHDLRLAPDGRRMALTVLGDDGLDLWVVDLERGSLARRTFDGTGLGPVWSPDGRWLLAASRGPGGAVVSRLPAAGPGEGQPLWTDGALCVATSWSPDGRHVAISRLTADQGWDLWLLRPDAEAQPWLVTPFNESRAQFSPDGRYLAYESDETGRREVYVRPYPEPAAQWTISTAGGSHPLWSPDGRQIWFRRGAEIYSAAIRFEPSLEIGLPESRFHGVDVPGHNLAIDDGGYWILEPQVPAEPALTFIVNWMAEM